MKRTRFWPAAVFALSLSFYGCATYVNIPPQAGDVAWHSPNNPNVLAVEATAIKAVVDDWQLGQTFTVKALPGTSPLKYFAMLRHIGDHATIEHVEGAPRIEVRQLYIRGSSANVDIVRSRGVAGGTASTSPTDSPAKGGASTGEEDTGTSVSPRSEGERQLVTVHLNWMPFSGWRAERVRVWRMHVDEARLSSAGQSASDEVP